MPYFARWLSLWQHFSALVGFCWSSVLQLRSVGGWVQEFLVPCKQPCLQSWISCSCFIFEVRSLSAAGLGTLCGSLQPCCAVFFSEPTAWHTPTHWLVSLSEVRDFSRGFGTKSKVVTCSVLCSWKVFPTFLFLSFFSRKSHHLAWLQLSAIYLLKMYILIKRLKPFRAQIVLLRPKFPIILVPFHSDLKYPRWCLSAWWLTWSQIAWRHSSHCDSSRSHGHSGGGSRCFYHKW